MAISRRSLLSRLTSTAALGGLVSGCGSGSSAAGVTSPAHATNIVLVDLPLGEGVGNQVRNLAGAVSYTVANAQASGKYGEARGPVWKSGKSIAASSLRFDGYSTLVRMPGLARNALANGLTVSAWIAPYAFEWGDAPDSPRLSALVSQIDLGKGEGLAFGVYRHGTWGISVGDGFKVHDLLVTDGAARVRRNAWSHIAWTYDRTAKVARFYRNGIEVLTGAVNLGQMPMPNKELLVGRHSEPHGIGNIFKFNAFAGLANHVRVHNHALSGKQVADLVEADLAGGKAPDLEFDDVDIGRAYLGTDRHRPSFHAQPNFGWMNEPHAPIFYNEKYHLFYQKNPFGPFWHQIHWGHWVSDDMVRWQEVEMALAPSDEGRVTTNIRPASASYATSVAPDGMWSGSATYDADGKPVLLFTAGNDSKIPSQAIGLAMARTISDPLLQSWDIHPMPVISQGAGIGMWGEFRDPFVFYDQAVSKYFALITSGTSKSGTALVYESDELRNWTYRGPLFESDLSKYPGPGAIWELPVLLPVGADLAGIPRWAFFVNAHGRGAKLDVYYWLGTWNPVAAQFSADSEAPRVFDCGEGYFTGPSGFVDPKSGRSILFSIAQGTRSSQFDYDSGWAHSAGMPVELQIGADGDLHVRPIVEIDSLRGAPLLVAENVTLSAANAALSALRGNALDIEIQIGGQARLGVAVRMHANGSERTDIVFDAATRQFGSRRDRSTLDPAQSDTRATNGEVRLDPGPLRLRVLVDGSLIEAYLNEKYSLTTRAYPVQKDANGLALIGAPDLLIEQLAVYPMRAI